MEGSQLLFNRINSPYIKAVQNRREMLKQHPVVDIGAAITEVHINTQAHQFLPPEYRYLASEAFLAQCAVMISPEQHATAHSFSPQSWMRSLTPASYPEIRYANNVYGGVIQTKGNLANPESYYSDSAFGPDPWGFFGEKEAMIEADISNKLLSCGFPAGLVLGSCTLQPDLLKNLISYYYSHQPTLQENILDNLKKVSDYQDMPAILIRLTDTFSRLEEIGTKPDNGVTAEALEHFCFFNPELKAELLRPMEHNQELPAKSLIDELIISTDKEILKNAWSLIHAFKTYPDLKRHRSLTACLVASKDIGHHLVTVDFEQLDDNLRVNEYLTNPPDSKTSSYRASMMRRMKSYYYYLFRNVCTQGPVSRKRFSEVQQLLDEAFTV